MASERKAGLRKAMEAKLDRMRREYPDAGPAERAWTVVACLWEIIDSLVDEVEAKRPL